MGRLIGTVFSSGVPGRLRPFCVSPVALAGTGVSGTSTSFFSAGEFEDIAYIVKRPWFFIARAVCSKVTAASGFFIIDEVVSSLSEKRDRRGLRSTSCTLDMIFFSLQANRALRLQVVTSFGVIGEDSE